MVDELDDTVGWTEAYANRRRSLGIMHQIPESLWFCTSLGTNLHVGCEAKIGTKIMSDTQCTQTLGI